MHFIMRHDKYFYKNPIYFYNRHTFLQAFLIVLQFIYCMLSGSSYISLRSLNRCAHKGMSQQCLSKNSAEMQKQLQMTNHWAASNDFSIWPQNSWHLEENLCFVNPQTTVFLVCFFVLISAAKNNTYIYIYVIENHITLVHLSWLEQEQ